MDKFWWDHSEDEYRRMGIKWKHRPLRSNGEPQTDPANLLKTIGLVMIVVGLLGIPLTYAISTQKLEAEKPVTAESRWK